MIRETTEEYIREMITPRPQDAHKGSCGRVLLVCGSPGMTGAAVLCARAALRSGAGLVTVCVPRELFPILQTAVPEAMCADRDSMTDESFDLNRFDCIAAGPGLGNGREQYRILEHLLVSYRGPLVVDADGINSICGFGRVPEKETYMSTEASQETDALDIPRKMTSILPEITSRRKAPVILTPHPGEADRLLDALGQQKYGELGREKAAEVLARESGAIVVLKGPGTLVAAANTSAYGAGCSPTEPDIYRNPTGNPGMAAGGSGDVLTGVIAALVAYGAASADKGGLAPMDAARAAVYIHGLAGDIAAEKRGEIGMISSDIVDALPEAFFRIAGR